MDKNYKYPPDTSWFPAWRRGGVWKVFAISLCITAPVFGFLGFWIAYAVGMSSFGPKPDAGLLDLLALFTRFPLPHGQSIPLIVLNSVFWAACASLLIGVLLGGTPENKSDRDDPPQARECRLPPPPRPRTIRPMQYTSLGRTGLNVSRLCLGTTNFGPFTPGRAGRDLADCTAKHAGQKSVLNPAAWKCRSLLNTSAMPSRRITMNET